MINRTTQLPGNEISRRLPAVERQVRDMKNKQFAGADTLSMLTTPIASFVSTSIAAGDFRSYLVFWNYLSNPSNFISELGADFFADTYDANHLIPTGGSLTVDQEKIVSYMRWSPAFSDMTGTGKKAYIIINQNTGVLSHVVMTDLTLLYPDMVHAA